MLPIRTQLVFPVIPLGLVVGVLAWAVAGGAGADASLSKFEDRFEALRFRSTVAMSNASKPPAGPLFALTSGPGAVAEIPVSLQGVSRMPGRVAALLAIGGKSPTWVVVGETRDDVTLHEVRGAKVVIDTPLRMLEVRLGDSSVPQNASAPAPVAAPLPVPVVSDSPPPGFRSPRPPASAPGMSG